jgi:hypothetical protein
MLLFWRSMHILNSSTFSSKIATALGSCEFVAGPEAVVIEMVDGGLPGSGKKPSGDWDCEYDDDEGRVGDVKGFRLDKTPEGKKLSPLEVDRADDEGCGCE